MKTPRWLNRQNRFFSLLRATSVVTLMSAAAGMAVVAISDPLVTVGSPTNRFPQNKQNEPGLAINPINPMIVVAGANDEIDLEACNAGDPTSCPFTQGVGLSGISFSFDGGHTWTQPTYTGWTAR